MYIWLFYYLGHCSDGDSECDGHFDQMWAIAVVPAVDGRSTADENEEHGAEELGQQHAPDIAILRKLFATE